jgi:recombination associated protein RdgC
VNRHFSNIKVYRVHSAWPADEEALSELLEAAEFKPCGAFSERSAGFEAPVENAGKWLCRKVSDAVLLQLRVQTRLLPVAAVQEALVSRITAFKKRMNSEPNRAERRELKEEVYSQLLPQALLKSDRVQGFFLHNEGLLVIGTASEQVAEYFLDQLKRAMVGLQYSPLAFQQSPLDLMNKHFLGNAQPPLRLGRECRMRDPSDTKASVNWLDMELSDPAVRRHVTEGLKIDRLGVTYDQVCSFVIDEDLIFRKVRLLGRDDTDDVPEEDPLAKHDAEFIINAGCVKSLINTLKAQLGGYVGA